MRSMTETQDQEAVSSENPSGNGATEVPIQPDDIQADWSAAREERELCALLEALLFVSHEPIPVDRLVTVLGSIPRAEVKQALQRLREDFDRDGRGLQVVELAGGYQVVTRPDYAPWIKRLEKAKSVPKLSRSALETLSIIAYKQPVIRPEIEEIRGVETAGVLRTLLERKLVRIVGRKEAPGRPILYGTTKFFLQHFGLRDLADLPPLREVKELGPSEQAWLPVGDGGLEVSGDPAAGATDDASPESVISDPTNSV